MFNINEIQDLLHRQQEAKRQLIKCIKEWTEEFLSVMECEYFVFDYPYYLGPNGEVYKDECVEWGLDEDGEEECVRSEKCLVAWESLGLEEILSQINRLEQFLEYLKSVEEVRIKRAEEIIGRLTGKPVKIHAGFTEVDLFEDGE